MYSQSVGFSLYVCAKFPAYKFKKMCEVTKPKSMLVTLHYDTQGNLHFSFKPFPKPKSTNIPVTSTMACMIQYNTSANKISQIIRINIAIMIIYCHNIRNEFPSAWTAEDTVYTSIILRSAVD